jgi:hypothetical protein
MKVWIYGIIFVIGAIYAATQWIKDRRRATAIRALAHRLGFSYVAKSKLPEALSLYGTPLANPTSTWNIIDGERDKIRVIAFDCQIGSGKGSWRRTAIAARTTSEVFGAVAFNPDLAIGRSGGWMILYYPQQLNPPLRQGLMPVAELEAHLEAIRQ